MKISQYIPAIDWISDYGSTQLKGDLTAGLTVGIMLIPQGMAYAMIAGLPPIYGLYASTLPLIIYALLGTSRQLAVGPVAMVSLLTATGIGAMAEADSESYISLAIALALIVGMIQFLLGVFRLGFLVSFLSHPVISGFTSAAALIIGVSQLKHLLGIKLSGGHRVHEIIIEAIQQINQIHPPTFLLGIGGIVLIVALKMINRRIPGLLIAVFLAILVVWVFNLAETGVSIVGSVPQGLPSLQWPGLEMSTVGALMPTALAIALVSFMESYAVAKAIQSKHKDYKIDANQELVALGLANIGGATFQSYPVTGGFSRTAVNDEAGAKTGMASLVSALLIILTLLFLTPLFHFLPNAILASVIMVAVFGLIDVKEVKHLWRTNRYDLAMLIVTFVATLILGIEQGIALGVILSLAIIIWKTTRPHVAELGQVPGTEFYRNIKRFKQVKAKRDLLIIRFDAQLYFANIGYFRDQLEEMISTKGDELKAIIINAESINSIDSTAMHALEGIVKELRGRSIEIYMSGVIGPVRDALVKTNLLDLIGEKNFFMSVHDAVEYHESPTSQGSTHKDITLQSNVQE